MPHLRVPSFVGFFGLLVAVSAFSFVSADRWIGRAFPRLSPSARAIVRVVLVVAFVEPAFRWFPAMAHAGDGVRIWLALGSVVQFGVFVVFAPMGAAHVLASAWRARRDRASARVDHSPSAEPVDAERRRALERTVGLVATAAGGSMLGFGATRGRADYRLVEVAVPMPGLSRALDGLTILQLSDLHLGALLRDDDLARGLDVAKGVRADLVLVTGDIVDDQARYAAAAARRIADIPARFGAFCVPGNHDHYAGADAVMRAMARAGVEPLVNRGKLVAAADGGLALVGVDELWARKLGRGPDLARALASVPGDVPRVLLAHQPRFADELVEERIELQLSGHTHGGQINPGFSPLGIVSRYVAGLYPTPRGGRVYVNRGFGTTGPPVRIGAPPEVTKLVLVAS